MGTIKATNIEPIADNGTVTLGSSGDIFTLGSGVNNRLLRPAFEAYLSSNQTIGNASWTKVTWNAETYDTDSAFASNKFTVPSGKNGKYFVYASTCFTANTTGQRLASLYVNGSERRRITGINGSGSNQAFSADGAVLELSASDYVEVYVYQDRGGNLELIGLQARSYFGAYRIGT